MVATFRGWTAAAEALAAFVRSYVVPSSTLNDKEILLQPIVGYLSGYFSARYFLSPVECSIPYRRQDMKRVARNYCQYSCLWLLYVSLNNLIKNFINYSTV